MTHQNNKAASFQPIEWDFDSIPDSELVACCYWEYARESAFITEADLK